MKNYAKVISQETKQCDIGIGTNIEFYRSLGMEEMEVEQAYNGNWYVKGYAPEKPAPTETEIQAALTQAVQAHLDSKAQERNYDNIHTACTYINSSDPVFASEASTLLLWRDKVWRECYAILDDVKAGRRPIPSVSELLAELPEFHWPDEVITDEVTPDEVTTDKQ